MRILQIHNRYRSGPSGEDIVVQLERDMLSRRGHVVECFYGTNKGASIVSWQQFAGALNAIWSRRSYAEVRNKIREFHPDIIHVHNTFASLSPSVHWAAKDAGVPNILTLHNYRIACPSSGLFRNMHICEECIGRVPTPAIIHRCRYVGSWGVVHTVAATDIVHRALGTFKNKVDGFIVLSEFQKHLMISAGLPEARIFVKPNFVTDPNGELIYTQRHQRVVFVGQIATIKGIDLIVDAWQKLRPSGWQLEIFGDGTERKRLQKATAGDHSIVWKGLVSREEVLNSIASSRYLALPSRWYEPFGLVIAEAMAAGTPPIVSNVGHLPTMITHGRDGIVCDLADPNGVTKALQTALNLPEKEWHQMAQLARHSYLEMFTEDGNYGQLMEIYQRISRT